MIWPRHGILVGRWKGAVVTRRWRGTIRHGLLVEAILEPISIRDRLLLLLLLLLRVLLLMLLILRLGGRWGETSALTSFSCNQPPKNVASTGSDVWSRGIFVRRVETSKALTLTSGRPSGILQLPP